MCLIFIFRATECQLCHFGKKKKKAREGWGGAVLPEDTEKDSPICKARGVIQPKASCCNTKQHDREIVPQLTKQHSMGLRIQQKCLNFPSPNCK